MTATTTTSQQHLSQKGVAAFLNQGNPHSNHLQYFENETHFFDIHLGTKYSKHFEQFESGPIFLFPGAATQLAGAGPI